MRLKKILSMGTALNLRVASTTAQARADILLEVEIQFVNAEYSLPFTATSTMTPITFAGYQPPAFEIVTDISVAALGDSTNLLSSQWIFIPALDGSSYANTFNDGTPVPALLFAGIEPGLFDRFTQTIATEVGKTYDLTFHFTNPVDYAHDPITKHEQPSAWVVSTDPARVPEPSSLATLGLGIIGFYALAKSRANKGD